MKTQVAFLLLFILLILGCIKENDNNKIIVTDSIPNKIKDSILYTVVNPHVVIGYENAPNQGNPWWFDLDKDSVKDFTFSPGYGYEYGNPNPVIKWFCIYSKDSCSAFRRIHTLLNIDEIVTDTCQKWWYEYVFYATLSDVDSDTCKYMGL